MRTISIAVLIGMVAASVLISGCGQDSGAYKVDVSKDINRTDTLGLESIATRIDTLTIRTDTLYDISLFGVSKDRYFGKTADGRIVILDREGRVLNAVKRMGRGPGEYMPVLADMSYDPYHDEIQILDMWNKVIRLDSDGNLKEEIRNDETRIMGDIMPLSADRYAATGISNVEREYSITILDRALNQVGEILPIQTVAQRSNVGMTILEVMWRYNSKVLYQPFGQYTYYELSDTSYTPYLEVDYGRYMESAESRGSVDAGNKEDYFQVQSDYICGKYYLVQYLYQKDMCWYHDIFDITTGERISHYRYGMEDYERGVDEGFILRFGGQRYELLPQYVEDNVLYWSRFNEDGTTTLFRITL